MSKNGQFRAYAELMRLPNVFTAMADVMMGFLVARRAFASETASILAMLVGASACLYLAGMVFNDLFDHKIDAKERPERPIPSGRVSVSAATVLGVVLMIAGLALAGGVSVVEKSAMPVGVATGLAALVLLYNKVLKHTWLGPVAMGGCRTFNVLLGMSGSDLPLQNLEYLIAAGVGVYVMGITVFARREEKISDRRMLIGGLAIMLVGIGMIVAIPWFVEDWRLNGLDYRWPAFWLLITSQIVWRCGKAIVIPSPDRVRAAVKNGIMSIIVIDAAASLATAGLPLFSMLILVLIVPATFLGRWIYST